MTIRVVKPGFFTTVQDRGRYGYAHLGISPAGAADALSLRIANLLVGNDENAPALEMTLLGATLEFDGPAAIAIGGARVRVQSGRDRDTVRRTRRSRLQPVLSYNVGVPQTGARCYLAVRGGFDVPLVMGSASTDIRGRFGGVEGRRLQRGICCELARRGTQPRRLRTGAMDSLQREGRFE